MCTQTHVAAERKRNQYFFKNEMTMRRRVIRNKLCNYYFNKTSVLFQIRCVCVLGTAALRLRQKQAAQQLGTDSDNLPTVKEL